MKKVIAIAGYGPGIGAAVAEKFGSKGFAVALLARTQSKLDAAAADLKTKGISAEGFSVDLMNAALVKKTLEDVAAKLGPITVLHWNAYATKGAGSILTLNPEQLHDLGALTFAGFVTAAQTVVAGFEGHQGTAILFTSADMPAELGVQYGLDALGAAKAAQRKLLDALRITLQAQGKSTYVGEVLVHGPVRGTEFAAGVPPHHCIDPAAIADKFYTQYAAAGPDSAELAPGGYLGGVAMRWYVWSIRRWNAVKRWKTVKRLA